MQVNLLCTSRSMCIAYLDRADGYSFCFEEARQKRKVISPEQVRNVVDVRSRSPAVYCADRVHVRLQ